MSKAKKYAKFILLIASITFSLLLAEITFRFMAYREDMNNIENLDIINNTGNGFPYEHNNIGGLNYAISKLSEFDRLSDKERYDHLIRMAKENIEKHSIHKTVDQYKEIIMQLYAE